MNKNKSIEEVERKKFNVFLILSGIFLSSMTMLNILGTSRFLDLSFSFYGYEIPMIVAVGVLPYPITFLCTDLISELYGPKKAKSIVWTGLIVNLWLGAILWLGGIFPEFTTSEKSLVSNNSFMVIRELALGTIIASMVAYFLAQYFDVIIFHFFKKLTKGKHLWLRNNVSTMVSQLIDTTSVICITHFLTGAIPIPEDKPVFIGLIMLIGYAYIFKFVFAILDTPVFYILTKYLKNYLRIKNDS